MTLALLVALICVNVLYVLHLERKDRRHDEQVNHLLVHVQAPEVAVATAAAIPEAGDSYPVLDDEDHWDEREAAFARVRAIENGNG